MQSVREEIAELSRTYREERPEQQALPPLPPSLADVEPDFPLTVDGAGNLVPTVALKDLFEFYLSGLGEADLDTLYPHLLARLDQALSEPARSQAMAILDDFLTYRLALQDLQDDLEAQARLRGDPVADGSDLAHQLDREHEIRALHLGSEVHRAFYGDQEAEARYLLAQRHPDLGNPPPPLPDSVAQARAQAGQVNQARETVLQMRQAGASESEIRQYREDTFGTEAAERMAALDQERSSWEQRVARFEQEREQIDRAGLSTEDRRSAVEALIDQHFEGGERFRIRAREFL